MTAAATSQGALVAWKNGAYLGVITRELSGLLCWGVHLFEAGSSVRISGLTPEEQANALKVHQEAASLHSLCRRIREKVLSWSANIREFQMMTLKAIRVRLAQELNINTEAPEIRQRVKHIVVDVIQNLD